MSHSSISLRWKRWLHGRTRTRSPFVNISRQIAHSICLSTQGGWHSSSSPIAGGVRGDWDAGDVVPRSRSGDEEGSSEGSSEGGYTAACFSQPVPVQTPHGRRCTNSSGARSRWAARAARTRWINSVMKVSIDGRRRMIINVIMGLERVRLGIGKSARGNGVVIRTNTTPMQNTLRSEVTTRSSAPDVWYWR